MSTQIQVRRGTAAEWTAANPVLAQGELAAELDTGKFKIGNGVTAWTALAYSSGIQGIQGETGPQGIQGIQGIQGETGPQGAPGEVVGPSSSVDSEIALFSATTGKIIKRATTTGLLKATSGVLAAAVAGTDYVKPDTATTYTATQTFKGVGETQYSLTGTDLAVSNGTVQYKTLTANTTFTESLADGQGVILMLDPSTFTTTWPTATWIGTEASTAPTLIASVYNCLVFFQMNGTLYGRYVGRV